MLQAEVASADLFFVTLALAPVTPADVRERVTPVAWRAVVEHVAVWAALLWWALPLTRGTGGREPHLVSIGLALGVAAVVMTAPWRRLRLPELVAATSLPVAALVVCLMSPIGWRGANDIGSWALASSTYVALRSYGSTTARRHGIVAALALAGLAEFSASWLAWWGGQDPSRPMIGTFYWHNQYGAFLLAPAVIGAALAVWPQRSTRAIGWVVTPVCSAGVLFSTSRATLGLLVLGWALVGAVALRSSNPMKSIGRLLALGAITGAVTFGFTGPPMFAHRATPSSGVADRSAQQSAGGNAEYRTMTWRQAVEVFEAHPVSGTGFHGFLSASTAAAPRQPHSAFAHDAWLQAFADGGVVLGIPFLVASLALAVALLRRLWRGIRSRIDEGAAVTAAAALLLAAHSLVDFDTSYPALFVLLAAAGAVGFGAGSVSVRSSERSGRLARVAVAALVLVAAVALAPSWRGSLHLNLNVPGAAAVPGGAG